jgi:hypothetical protein
MNMIVYGNSPLSSPVYKLKHLSALFKPFSNIKFFLKVSNNVLFADYSELTSHYRPAHLALAQ